MEYKPREIPDGVNVNVTKVHPLVNFGNLLITVIVFSGLIYLGLGFVADRLVTRISPAMEMKIGQQFVPKSPKTISKSRSQQLEYLKKILLSFPLKDVDTAIPLTLHIQKSDIPNAAIFPGGHIMFTTALLKTAESENEIAFVLAHELGHFVARDPLKGLGRSLVFVTVASALGLGSNSTDIVGLTGSVTNLHYSRKQETAADIYALSAMVKVYGHAGFSLDFFERMKVKDDRSQLDSYFSTHPLTEDRIEYLQELAKSKGWQTTGEKTELPEGIFD